MSTRDHRIEPVAYIERPFPIGAVAHAPSPSSKSSQNVLPSTPISLKHLFSTECHGFDGSDLRKSALRSKPDLIRLGTGRPAAELYPWKGNDLAQLAGMSNGKPNSSVANREAFGLAAALNYGHAKGSPFLNRFFTEHVEMIHSPPYHNWETCLTSGTTSGLETALRIFCNRGDVILAEEYTYPGFKDAASLLGLRVHGIKMDQEGLRSDSLQSLLDTWDDSHGPRPRVLYTVPTGQNPTGITQSASRRKAIYEIAERYDIVIVEDDAYFYLRLGAYHQTQDGPTSQTGAADSALLSNYSLLPSYLSLDKSGRVVRLDSVSKILAPGLRLGWVTASEEVIGKFASYHEVSTVSPSGLSQLALYKLLEIDWGQQGFLEWLQDLSARYRNRRDLTLQACYEHLSDDICQFAPPSDGMFLWVCLNLKRHPLFQAYALKKSHDNSYFNAKAEVEQRIHAAAFDEGVQVTQGSMFKSDTNATGDLCFRITFAAAPESDLSEGIRRFASVVKREFDMGK